MTTKYRYLDLLMELQERDSNFMQETPLKKIHLWKKSDKKKVEHLSTKQLVEQIQASTASIYDEDNITTVGETVRPSTHDANFINKINQQSESVCILIDRHSLKEYDENHYKINFLKSFTEENPEICIPFNFGDEARLSGSTGFLIADNIIITVEHALDCSNYTDKRIIFNFNTSMSKGKGVIPKSDVYFIKRIIDQRYNPGNSYRDSTIAELDRPRASSSPLIYDNTSNITNGAELYMLGHPLGLPLRLSSNGKVIDDSNKTMIRCDLDSFKGNSGSPVFSKETGNVIGILSTVGGLLEHHQEHDCLILVSCSTPDELDNFNCRLVDVVRISELPLPPNNTDIILNPC